MNWILKLFKKKKKEINVTTSCKGTDSYGHEVYGNSLDNPVFNQWDYNHPVDDEPLKLDKLRNN